MHGFSCKYRHTCKTRLQQLDETKLRGWRRIFCAALVLENIRNAQVPSTTPSRPNEHPRSRISDVFRLFSSPSASFIHGILRTNYSFADTIKIPCVEWLALVLVDRCKRACQEMLRVLWRWVIEMEKVMDVYRTTLRGHVFTDIAGRRDLFLDWHHSGVNATWS